MSAATPPSPPRGHKKRRPRLTWVNMAGVEDIASQLEAVGFGRYAESIGCDVGPEDSDNYRDCHRQFVAAIKYMQDLVAYHEAVGRERREQGRRELIKEHGDG